MKVVHVSTSDMGGAGIAARRLHLSLLEAGIDSFLLTKFSFVAQTPRHRAVMNAPLTFKKRLRGLLIQLLPFLENDVRNKLKGRKSGFEYFSFPFPGEDLRTAPEIRSADIVHLHWVADGMLDYKEFFGSLKKPVVWTLHDMNPFTGGCHHADDSDGFTRDCANCPQLAGTNDPDMARRNLNYKIKSMAGISDTQLSVVTPSAWLSALSKKSTLFRRFQHFVIPNVVGSGQFRLLDRRMARMKHNIAADVFVLLFVANDVGNPRKGISTLQAALNDLDIPGLMICTVGKGAPQGYFKHPCHNFGFVTGEDLMTEIYNTADVFVLPSVAENFPNTVVEALLCGVPVIASRVGGIPGQIDDTNGRLFAPGASVDLADQIKRLYDTRASIDRLKIREAALKKYSDETINRSYLVVYDRFNAEN